MKKLLNKKIVLVSLLFITFLLFFKIDFRFAESIYCCGDDYDGDFFGAAVDSNTCFV